MPIALRCWNLWGKEVLIEASELTHTVRARYDPGVDAVLDIIGNTTVFDSLAMVRRVCLVGFLGGGGPLALEPVFQIPSGRYLSVFASALVTGTSEFPCPEVPLQAMFDRVAAGTYKAKPARIFRFDQIQEAHRLAESNQAGGKIVVTLN